MHETSEQVTQQTDKKTRQKSKESTRQANNLNANCAHIFTCHIVAMSQDVLDENCTVVNFT